ncbi:hypothetical protein SAMN05421852_1221 [Thermoflavimicrobium dichotomicum]|uniref:Uncharacterized protein n=1 Tax=Thermoflavimicrobium dichotomicum TaxID=46223 RepID=A0A1I3U556_9BACL|nr:hypothetical protein SAMN05421852_1221 [Thermoflavimicrobium dichotomicum]
MIINDFDDSPNDCIQFTYICKDYTLKDNRVKYRDEGTRQDILKKYDIENDEEYNDPIIFQTKFKL